MIAAPLQKSALRRALPTLAPVARAYGLYVGGVCLLLWPSLSSMVWLWTTSSSHHHGFVVAPLTLAMIVARPAAAPARVWPVAAAAVAASGALWLAGRAAGANIAEHIAFVSLLIAGAAFFFGAARMSGWAFPLVFLFFMVPFGESLTPLLLPLTAGSAMALLSVSGVEASIQGALIETPGGRFLVSEACAGLNFLLAALMIAALFARLRLSGWRKQAGFLLFAVVIALGANTLRAFAIVALANVAGGRFAISNDHVLLGWVFYAILLIALVSIGERFANPAQRKTIPAAPSAPFPGRTLAISLLFLASVAAYGRFVVDRAPQDPALTALAYPSAPGWRIAPPDAQWRAPVVKSDLNASNIYASPFGVVQVDIAYLAWNRPDREIGAQQRLEPGARLISLRTELVRAFGAATPLRIETIELPPGVRMDIVTLYWLGEQAFPSRRALKLSLMKERLMGSSPAGGAISITAPASEDAAVIKAFLHDVEPLAAWLDRNRARRPG